MVTAIGGGIVRDLLIGVVPPAIFSDWRYLVVATAGGSSRSGWAVGFSG